MFYFLIIITNQQTISAITIPNVEIQNGLIGFFSDWQTLLGAIIGAAIPLFFWFFVEWKKNKSENRKSLYLTYKYLIYVCNTIDGIKNEIEKFLNERLEQVIQSIQEHPKDKYCMITIAFPSPQIIIDKNILGIKIESQYIENEVLDILRMLTDFQRSINELGEQFKTSIQTNQDIIYQKINPPDMQIESFLKNMLSFKEIVQEVIIRKNVPFLLKKLISAQKAIEMFINNRSEWNSKFLKEGSMIMFFQNKKSYEYSDLEKKIKEHFDKIAVEHLTKFYGAQQ